MQKPIDTIIIEDEPLPQERIRGYAEKLSFLRLRGVFDNGTDALAFLQTNPADLIFLDINLGDFFGYPVAGVYEDEQPGSHQLGL
jgi:two-component system LytT family response regulator